MPVAAPAAKAAPAKKPATLLQSARELAETIAFVVTLVLMLKMFVVEAFVIPTGSMAETLYGYQKQATCPECAFTFPVNSSTEVEPPDEQFRARIAGACCPNCRHRFVWDANGGPGNRSGDRVLVHKGIYSVQDPAPGDVVVFKYPVDPQLKQTAQNYIKRLWGLGGQTVGINRGDLYRSTGVDYPADEKNAEDKPRFPRPADPLTAWEGPETTFLSKTFPRSAFDNTDYTYHNADPAVERFEKSRRAGFADPGGFELIRKSDEQLLAMRRIVYDNDHQAQSLVKRGAPPRWRADDAGWAAAAPGATEYRHSGALGWLRYRHFAPRTADAWNRFGSASDPVDYLGPVTNFMGYNAGLEDGRGEARNTASDYWVGDLILECQADFGADASVVLELSKGPHRYQATFAGGTVKLARVGPQGKPAMGEAATGFTTGTHRLRFANVDCRLRVWVDGRALTFGPDADYAPDQLPEVFETKDRGEEGIVEANDVAAPASVGVSGDAAVRKLVLWRDTYFTSSDTVHTGVARYADTFFVQPGHYFVMGDNSAQSSDSRKWGSVPERLLLGKAGAIFFPLGRIGVIK